MIDRSFPATDDALRAAIDLAQQLARQRASADSPQAFWSSQIELMAETAGASYAMVLVRAGEGDPPKAIASWPESPPAVARSFLASAPGFFADVIRECVAVRSLDGAEDAGGQAVGLALATGDDAVTCAALLFVPGEVPPESLKVLAFLASEPAVFQLKAHVARARQDLAHFSSVLDVLVGLNEEVKFVGAGIRLCNDLSARYACDRVSVGWLENGEYIKLRAISHTEHFDGKMEAVRCLEFAMEEAADQDDEIVWPQPEGEARVVRDHETYGSRHGAPHLCSLPLRTDGACVGVVTCERQGRPFAEADVRLLRAACDLCARRLDDLKRLDRWWGARLVEATKRRLATWVGFEHTWAKATAALVAMLIAILVFGWVPYRVEAPFILQAEETVHVSAPFAGYISEVHVRPGDVVKRGDALLEMDTRDLLLDEAAASADFERSAREADKARAEGKLADMRVAQALVEQARARRDLVRYRLDQARVSSPIDGVVAEGDLRDKIGAPIQQGDALYRIVSPAQMYAELKVSERDIHEIREQAAGTVAFTSRPRNRFPVRVERVEPVAQSGKSDNVFVVRCQLDGAAQSWWRPGMSGVAKVRVGWRNILWIFTHRTMDFLRLRLWW